MKRILIAFIALLIGAVALSIHSKDNTLQVTLDRYDQAVQNKDLETVRSVLSPDIIVYEQSVINFGLQDAFENHLKLEIADFENLKMEFSNGALRLQQDLKTLGIPIP